MEKLKEVSFSRPPCVLTVSEQLDTSLVHLTERLNATSMEQHVNLVLLSDHGMAPAGTNKAPSTNIPD